MQVPQYEEEEDDEEITGGPLALSSSIRYSSARGSVRTLCGAVGYVRGNEGTLKLSMIKGSAAFVYGASELVSWGHRCGSGSGHTACTHAMEGGSGRESVDLPRFVPRSLKLTGRCFLVCPKHSESFAGLPRGVVLGVIMSALPLACWVNAVFHYVLTRKSLVLPLPHVVRGHHSFAVWKLAFDSVEL
jgi:hypothetical protein